MGEKTIKHEIYKHGSYLYSLKEAGSNFVNIDDEIKKFDELFELASKNKEVIAVIGSGSHVNAHKLIGELQSERTE